MILRLASQFSSCTSRSAQPFHRSIVSTMMALTPESGLLQGIKALQVSKYGRLYQKDTWDVTCSLALALRPGIVKQRPFGKSYHNAFAGSDAVKCLESLTFLRSPENTRSHSSADENRPAPTILTLKLLNEDARTLMQHLIEARIVKDLTTSGHTQPFSKKAAYRFTVKGLSIIAELLRANGISPSEARHLASILATLPVVHPDLSRDTRHRSPEDDSFVITKKLVASVFYRFTGNMPNYGVGNGTGVLLVNFATRNRLLQDINIVEGVGALNGTISSVNTTHCFEVAEMIQWICCCTSINSEAEAAEFGAHFVRFGLITVLPDTVPKKVDASKTSTVTGPLSSSNPWVAEQGQFINVLKVVYAITDEGRRAAGWVVPQHNVHIQREVLTNTYTAHLSRQRSVARYSEPFDENSPNAIRLRTILSDDVTRKQFQSFLSERNFQHNVSFWTDMEDFKGEMAKAAKGKAPSRRPTMPEGPVASSSRVPVQGEPQSEPTAHGALSERPFLMYNTYFSPESTLGLRVEIGEDLAQELQQLLGDVLEIATTKVLSESVEPSYTDSMLDMDQLQILLELYGRVQGRVFRNMAVGYIPRFLKSPQFITTRLAAISDKESLKKENSASPSRTPLGDEVPLLQAE